MNILIWLESSSFLLDSRFGLYLLYNYSLVRAGTDVSSANDASNRLVSFSISWHAWLYMVAGDAQITGKEAKCSQTRCRCAQM